MLLSKAPKIVGVTLRTRQDVEIDLNFISLNTSYHLNFYHFNIYKQQLLRTHSLEDLVCSQ